MLAMLKFSAAVVSFNKGHAGRIDEQFLFPKWIEALGGKFDGVEDAREEVFFVVEKQLFSSFKNNT